jgi:hypothetical protein
MFCTTSTARVTAAPFVYFSFNLPLLDRVLFGNDARLVAVLDEH